jgi:hypothetical protein
MFTNDDLRARHERMFDRMITGGWLHSYTFTDGKGFHLVWTGPGAQHARMLRKIVDSFGLRDGPTAEVACREIAQAIAPSIGFLGPAKLDAPLMTCLGACIDNLSLQGDGDGLQLLFGICHTWAPDGDTPVKFG